MTTNPTRQVSNKATPARANKEKINAHDTGGCGDSRKTTAPAGPPANFGSVRSVAELGVARGAASVRDMEMHAVRRPVYGGPARMGRTEMAAQRNLAGGPEIGRAHV